jgi:peptidoglycan/LPS O-acetylase OafA/YrhL
MVLTSGGSAMRQHRGVSGMRSRSKPLSAGAELPAPVATLRRFPGVDGLRALAALSIVIVHTWSEASKSGHPDFGRVVNDHVGDFSYGVTLFFTLSGFLLYRPFAAALLRGDAAPSIRKYLRNRALRILPAYWVILLICALVVGGVLSRQGSELVDGRLTDPGLLARAALFVQDYAPSTMLTGIGPAWSLAVEVVFYLVLPLLALLAFRLGRGAGTRQRTVAALVPAATLLVVGLVGKYLTAVVVPAAHVWQGWSTTWHAVLERSILCQADLFSFGMALAVVHSLWMGGSFRLPRYWRPAAVAVGLLAYGAASRVSYLQAQLSYLPWNTVMAFACSLLLGLVVLTGSQGSLLVRLLEARPLVAAGVVSYSIFLWHHPLILSLKSHGLTFDGRAGFFLNLVIVLTLTLLFSGLSYRYVEAPALRLKLTSSGSPEASPPAQVQAAP